MGQCGERQALQRIERRGDRCMLGMLGLHMVAAVWFGSFYDTWLETWTIGGLASVMFLVAWWLQPGAFLTRCIAGVSLQAFVALHIYQLHGLAEMHFFFFTAFAAMLVYQDWLCMWPGALLIIVQHIVFAVLHNEGVNVFFFEDEYIGLTKLGFHFGIAIFHVGLCNLSAVMLRRQTLQDARTRAELEAARAVAERASAAKTTFLGDMSHELRTPMGGVLSMTELLLRQPLAAELRENLEVVRSSALAIVEIVDDALDLARVEAGRLSLADEPMDLRLLCEEVAELLAARARSRDVELVMRWQPGGPSQLRGDGGRWRQVLTNLAGNAIKFAGGGHVLIDVAVAPAGVGATTEVVVRIDDSGPGIPADVLPRLFQRFEQGGAATFARHGGSGLGLAISRELVQLMSGTVTVHSVEGAGATFVVRVPMRVAAPAEAVPTFPGRSLLVGTRELTLGVIAEQLEEMGGEVVVAHGPEAARREITAAAAVGRPFQMLFCDPAVVRDLDAAGPELRVVLLGSGDGPGERIVRIQRHHELRRIVAGRSRDAELARNGEAPLGLRVLLAEDDAVCAQVARRMLELFGCEVVHVGDGAAAVAKCRASAFDVVLMDCRMPGMDGLEATRRIRAAAQDGRRVPIVMLSANSLQSDRDECRRAGADAFLGKPVRLSFLRETLAAFVEAAPRLGG